MHPLYRTVNKLDQSGFTLIELVIIIVVLGIIASVAIPKFSNMSDAAKITATKSEMEAIKKAIVGNPAAISGGQYVDRGFEGDVGHPPTNLGELVAKPGSLSVYDNLTRLGWNGPYLDANAEYQDDAWGTNYIYLAGSRQLQSVGGSDTITVTF